MKVESDSMLIWYPKPETVKRCWKCREEKPLSEFSRDRSRGDGRDTLCKSCRRIFSKDYKSGNKEKIKEKGFLYNLSKNHGDSGLRVWFRDGGVCQKCGISRKSGKQIAIHHIDWNEKDNNLGNLVLLCKRCHNNIHRLTRLKVFVPEEHVLKIWREWFEHK